MMYIDQSLIPLDLPQKLLEREKFFRFYPVATVSSFVTVDNVIRVGIMVAGLMGN